MAFAERHERSRFIQSRVWRAPNLDDFEADISGFSERG
jgi:hypothetical protein